VGRYHLISTAVTEQACPRCRQVCLAGWSEGLFVHCDPVPLSPAGADAATESGRAVYILSTREFTYRDTDHRLLPGLLMPQHTCGQPAPAQWRSGVPTLTSARSVDQI